MNEQDIKRVEVELRRTRLLVVLCVAFSAFQFCWLVNLAFFQKYPSSYEVASLSIVDSRNKERIRIGPLPPELGPDLYGFSLMDDQGQSIGALHSLPGNAAGKLSLKNDGMEVISISPGATGYGLVRINSREGPWLDLGTNSSRGAYLLLNNAELSDGGQILLQSPLNQKPDIIVKP